VVKIIKGVLGCAAEMAVYMKISKNIIELFQWVISLGLAVAIALLIRAYVFEPVLVSGHSMDNTLADGQRLFEYKLGYHFNLPQRGDIVVLKVKAGESNLVGLPDPTEVDFIKRIIGLPGEEVDIKNGGVYINGIKLDETYAKGKTLPMSIKFPIKVDEGKVFVLGDNREKSSDSRVIGQIDIQNLRGQAVFRIWPFNNIGSLK
jgi:signal peptidase I